MTVVARGIFASIAMVAAAGCAPLIDRAEAPEDPGDAGGWQDCEPPYAFDGQSTIEALDVKVEGLARERTMVGHIRITRERVTHEEFAPLDTPVHVAEGQVLCATWQDGSGVAMMLPEPWPPAAGDGGAAGPPGLVVVALVALAIVGVSWVAFRRAEPHVRRGGTPAG